MRIVLSPLTPSLRTLLSIYNKFMFCFVIVVKQQQTQIPVIYHFLYKNIKVFGGEGIKRKGTSRKVRLLMSFCFVFRAEK